MNSSDLHGDKSSQMDVVAPSRGREMLEKLFTRDTLAYLDPGGSFSSTWMFVSNISCIGVFSSLILGLWCKRIEVGFENRSDVFYSKAAAISVERSSQKKSISGLKSSERAV
jgi:hypothetical protein